MKIFLSFLQGKPNHPIPAYSFWEYYIKQGIEEAGHTWTELPGGDWAEGLVPKSAVAQSAWKTKIWEHTIALLQKDPPQLFLSYLYPEQIDTGAILRIKEMGIPCVNFFCDNVRMFSHAPKEFSAFSLNWVPEYKALKMYQKARFKYIHLPMPMWVAPQHRIIRPETNSEIAFIGSKDIQRQTLFEQILVKEPGLNLNIYGFGWISEENAPISLDVSTPLAQKTYTLANQAKYQFKFIKEQGLSAYWRKLKQRSFNPPVSALLLAKLRGQPTFDEYIRLTQESMVTVGINRYPSFRHPFDKPDTYSRLRDIEAPMLGACYLTEWTEGIEDLYEIDKEIMVYRGVDEFVYKTAQLSQDSAIRNTLREKANARALNEHSIKNTISKILKALN